MELIKANYSALLIFLNGEAYNPSNISNGSIEYAVRGPFEWQCRSRLGEPVFYANRLVIMQIWNVPLVSFITKIFEVMAGEYSNSSLDMHVRSVCGTP